MANPKHVEIVKKGAEEIRAWREQSPGARFNLRGADLQEADLHGADLRLSDLSEANLSRANLSGADLRGCCIRAAMLHGTNLSEADLRESDLRHSNLTLANLSMADLSGADLRVARLHATDLTGASFYGTRCEWTIFADVDLSKVKGLQEVQHGFANSIGVDTLLRSKGRIPEEFLRRSGLPAGILERLDSLVRRTPDFCTCFIAFAKTDAEFSECLANDLQANGIRCWHWGEETPQRQSMIRSVADASRVYDKLIVVCSEQSLNALFVLHEIELALQKESNLTQQGRKAEVLFPIRLDDYVLERWEHHRKPDVLAKNIADFRNWKNSEAYQKALDQLIHDLQTEKRPGGEGANQSSG